MKTIIKFNSAAKKTKSKSLSISLEGKLIKVAIEDIDFSPLNHRRFYSQKELQEFAMELKHHPMIAPPLVRVMTEGRFEIVVGERRVRAARLAELKILTVKVVKLNDQQVQEIQLAENLQREDPHPINIAEAIYNMQQQKMSMEEIAARLGKSLAFVYNRIKLHGLIDEFKEMCINNAITMVEAQKIASLDTTSQKSLFVEECKNWKEEDDFSLDDLDYSIQQYKGDLANAPFDKKDKKLIPEMGACTGCSFNSATLKSLFPELAKEAICTNNTCYEKKTNLQVANKYALWLRQEKPSAIIAFAGWSKSLEKILLLIPEAADIPKVNYQNVHIIDAPQPPLEEDYIFEGEEHLDNPEIDTPGFEQAMEEYKEQLNQYNEGIATGSLQKAGLIQYGEMSVVYFSNEPFEDVQQNASTTAKEVQQAIKTNTATPELLQSEIKRLEDKERRSQELDRAKVQEKIHQAFTDFVNAVTLQTVPTRADRIAIRWLIYQSLNFSDKKEINNLLQIVPAQSSEETMDSIYQRLVMLTEEEFTFMVRKAITGSGDSSSPYTPAGFVLYRCAEEAGILVRNIEEAQLEKAGNRQERQQERITSLQKQMEKLTAVK